MKKILFVDDDPNILAGFQRQLRKQFAVETAVGPGAGLELLRSWRDYAVVVADMRMPEMSGVEFLVKVRGMAPDLVLMMLTGNADQATAVEAINQGNIFRFLNKPCPPDDLVSALEAALRQHELVTAERELLEKTLNGSIKVLTDILAMADSKVFGRAETLRDQTRLMAQALDLSRTWELEAAALLSNIGYVTLPPELALKSRLGHVLSAKEHEIMERLPEVGSNLLAQIPRLNEVARIILYQNQRFDGAGFPGDKLAGDELPAGSRILKVLSDLAQLEGNRLTRDAALGEMRKRAGWYDPRVLDVVTGALCAVREAPRADNSSARALTFANLRVGHVLVSDLETKDGVLIISAGNRITAPLMQRLRNFATLSGIKEPIHVEG
jgi:response regulator RpfG family c-di-GMP phosphodiesterase